MLYTNIVYGMTITDLYVHFYIKVHYWTWAVHYIIQAAG